MDEEYIWQSICFNNFTFQCSETTARNIIEGHTFVHTSTIYHEPYTVFLLSFSICIFLCPLTSYCYFFQVFNSFGRSLSIYHTNFMYRGFIICYYLQSHIPQKNVKIYWLHVHSIPNYDLIRSNSMNCRKFQEDI